MTVNATEHSDDSWSAARHIEGLGIVQIRSDLCKPHILHRFFSVVHMNTSCVFMQWLIVFIYHEGWQYMYIELYTEFLYIVYTYAVNYIMFVT